MFLKLEERSRPSVRWPSPLIDLSKHKNDWNSGGFMDIELRVIVAESSQHFMG